MRTEVNGRPLTDVEIVSVLRNWTGGDLGSIALCVGVLVHYLATHRDMQEQLRAGVLDAELDAILDEILRIDDPFVSNRRTTTCPVTIGGVELPEGARVKLNWTSANRDEAVFGDPDVLDPRGNADRNEVACSCIDRCRAAQNVWRMPTVKAAGSEPRPFAAGIERVPASSATCAGALLLTRPMPA